MHFFPLAQMIRSGLWINIGHCYLAVRCLVHEVATLNVYKDKNKACFGKEAQEGRRLRSGGKCSKLGSSNWLYIRRMCKGQYDRSVLLSSSFVSSVVPGLCGQPAVGFLLLEILWWWRLKTVRLFCQYTVEWLRYGAVLALR